MNKKKFALSWGRKMFFGPGWLLTSIMGLTYLQSMIIPQGFGSWMYFLTTLVGHYGVILSLVYFFIFCPVILIFPSYYISRIWSILLILTLNLGIFFDSYLFSRYHFHLNSFLWEILKHNRTLDVFGLTPFKLGLMGFVTFIFLVLFWIRGESLWRRMCARFSNPVKNWYLVVVAVCFITSGLIHMFSYAEGGGPVTRMANLFPLNFPVNGKAFLKKQGMIENGDSPLDHHYGNLYYPANSLKCSKPAAHHVVLVVVEDWKDMADKSVMPNLSHYAQHSLNFSNHHSGGTNAQDGYFSLMYSLPPIYSVSVTRQKTMPIFVEQMKNAQADVVFFKSEGTTPVGTYFTDTKEGSLEEITPYLNQRIETGVTKPFFMQVYLAGGNLTKKDAELKEVINSLIKLGLVEKSVIIVTGSHSNTLSTPLFVMWPGKRPGTITKLTSHYDVLSTLMLEDWRCKNKMSDVSLGKSLFSTEETAKLVVGNYEHLMILDGKEPRMATIDHEATLKAEGAKVAEMKLILEALNQMTMFYRPR